MYRGQYTQVQNSSSELSEQDYYGKRFQEESQTDETYRNQEPSSFTDNFWF